MVIVNEFGDVGLDGSLVRKGSEGMIELPGGCLCCTIEGDLLRTLTGLLKKRTRRFWPLRFDRILVETSGLASPGPVLRTLLVEENLAAAFETPRVVCLASTGELADQLKQHPEVREQLAHADTVVLSHWDRANEDDRERARHLVAGAAPGAKVMMSSREEWEPGGGSSDLLAAGPELNALVERVEAHAHVHTGERDGHHTQGVTALCLSSSTPLDREALDMWLRFLAARPEPRLLRVKGMVMVADGACLSVQGAGEWYGSEEVAGESSGLGFGESRLVLIGIGLDEAELRRGWAQAGAG